MSKTSFLGENTVFTWSVKFAPNRNDLLYFISAKVTSHISIEFELHYNKFGNRIALYSTYFSTTARSDCISTSCDEKLATVILGVEYCNSLIVFSSFGSKFEIAIYSFRANVIQYIRYIFWVFLRRENLVLLFFLR